MSNQFRFIIKFEGFVANSVPKVEKWLPSMPSSVVLLRLPVEPTCLLKRREKSHCRDLSHVTNTITNVFPTARFNAHWGSRNGSLHNSHTQHSCILHSMNNESFFGLLSRVDGDGIFNHITPYTESVRFPYHLDDKNKKNQGRFLSTHSLHYFTYIYLCTFY